MDSVSGGVVWESILAAVRSAADRRPSRLDEYLVDGCLLVTPGQYRVLLDACDVGERADGLKGPDPLVPWQLAGQSWPGIPVVVVDRVPVVLGDRLAIRGPGDDDTIYLFPKPEGWPFPSPIPFPPSGGLGVL